MTEIIQILIVLLLMLSGSGSAPKAVQRPPNGTYVTTITKAELISGGMTDRGACENAGTYSFSVNGDHWTSSQTPAPGCRLENATDSGTWTFSGDQVTFHEDQYLGCTQTYTYQWSFDGSALNFTPIADTCAPRVTIESSHSWVKQP